MGEGETEEPRSGKASLHRFREQLKQFAAAQEKPVIVFVDELDRCKPTFVVQFIERIKHFFEVPNLVFALLMNREQLENAIRGVYGDRTDASLYLGKFVRVFMVLPNYTFEEDIYSDSPLKGFIWEAIKKYDVDSAGRSIQNFRTELWLWTVLCRLTLREVEQIIAMYVYADCPLATGAAAYLLVMKVRNPK